MYSCLLPLTGTLHSPSPLHKVACLSAIAAERVMIARILHNAGLRLQDQLLNTLAFVDETRGILSEGAGVHTRASGTASLMSHNTLPRPLPSQPNVVPSFLSVCHQSISKDAQAGHVDVMGPMAESKVALTSGGGPWIEARLDASGAYQKIPVAACCFPHYDRATLLSAPGSDPCDMDVELSCNTPTPTPFQPGATLHMNRDPSLLASERATLSGDIAKHAHNTTARRGAYVRSLGRIYLHGFALCDHPAVVRGSAEWFCRMINRPDVGTRRRARAALALPGGYNAWRQLTPAQQHALALLS